jgi:hypothetical protein
MSSSYLLYAQTTGHVLAAATIAAPPPQDPKPEALAGALLPVRYIGHPIVPDDEVLVPADQLSILSVDSQSVPIGNALEFFINSQNTPEQWDPAKTIVSLSGTGTDLTITLPALTDTVSVWARVQPKIAGDSVQLASGSRTAIKKDVAPTVPPSPQPVKLHLLPLTPGNYSTLVLVSGFMPSLTTVTIS